MKTCWAAFCEDPREETFSPFYERSKGTIYTICLRVLQNEDDALDAFQGVYDRLLGICRNPEERRQVADIEAHVRRLAVREADRLRKARQRRLSKELAMNPLPERPAPQASPREIVDQQLRRARIEALVATLPDRYRLPIMLHYFDGMTHEQVAQALGISRVTVRTQIYRALRKLQPVFRRAGLGEAPLALAALAATSTLLQPPAALGAGAVLAHAQAAALAGTAAGMAVSSSASVASSLWNSVMGIVLVKGKLVAAGLVCLVAVLSLFVVVSRPGRPSAGNRLASQGPAPSPVDSPTEERVPSQLADRPSATPTPPPLLKAGSLSAVSVVDSATTGPRMIVTGRVLLLPDHSPAAGATVEALVHDSNTGKTWLMQQLDPPRTAATARADSQGRYRLEMRDQNYFQLLARRPGSASVMAHVYISSSQSLESFDVAPGMARQFHRDILLPAASELGGQVLDEQYRPVAAATISAIAVERRGQTNIERHSTGTTDASGRFSLTDVPVGDVEVRVAATGFVPTSELLMAPDKEAKIRLTAAGASIAGQVFHAETGEAVGGLKLVVIPQGNIGWYFMEVAKDWFRATTTPEGKFRFDHLPAGEYNLGIASETLALAEDQTITLTAREEHGDLELLVQDAWAADAGAAPAQVAASTRISGQVVHPQGLPLAEGQLEVYRATRSSDWPRGRLHPLGADGKFEVEVQQSAKVRLVARARGFAPTPSEVLEVADAPISGIRIELASGFSIFGTVVDSQGQPVRDANVTAGDSVSLAHGTSVGFWRWTASSDTTGQFLLADFPPGAVVLNVERDGYAFLQQEVTIDGKQPITSVRVVLGPSHYLAGTVTDEQGNAVEGADIEVNPHFPPPGSGGSRSYRFYRGQTDARGAYRVEGIPEAVNFSVWAKTEGASNSKTITQLDQDNLDFVLHVTEKPYLLGRVIDRRTRAVIPDFRVSVEGSCYAEKEPDTPGVFRLKGYGDWDTCQITLSAPGYATSHDISVRLSRDPQAARQVFELGPGVTISGRVVAGDAKSAQSGVPVRLRSSDGMKDGQTVSELTSDRDGGFVLADIAPGQYSISFEGAAPLVPLKKDLTVRPDQPVDLGDVELGGGATIQGRLVHRPGDSPVPDVLVVLRPQSAPWRSATTDSDGRFKFASLANERHVVGIDFFGLASSLENFSPEETCDLLFVVGDATLQGRIIREDLRNINSVSLVREDDLDKFPRVRREAKLQPDGRFEIKSLAAGRYRINIRNSNCCNPPSYRESFEVPATGVLEKVFTIPTGRITGRVVDAKGQGVARAIVSVRLPDVPINSTETESSIDLYADDDGRFTVKELKAGYYDLKVMFCAAGTAEALGVEIPPNGDSQPVQLRLGTGEKTPN